MFRSERKTKANEKRMLSKNECQENVGTEEDNMAVLRFWPGDVYHGISKNEKRRVTFATAAWFQA